jgi:pyruvate/2-oxoglutarate dehydrogenase complex dihydrolipoamide dehydrogenase (E3) component
VQVEKGERVMSRDEPEASAIVARSLRDDGVDLRVNASASRFAREGNANVLYVAENGGEIRIEFDKVLLALGRRANTEDLGLDAIGITTRENGTVLTNEFLQTRFPNIYACGDVAGPFQFTHTAAHQAWYAAVNGLFGVFRKFKADYRVIPWTTFTDPEVAHVGLTEAQAREQGREYEITTYHLDELDRAIADGTDRGFVKVITSRGSDQILGVTIVGADAGNLIAEFALAMKNKIGLEKILGTIHVYPTMAEANKYAAGEWKRAHAPERVLAWLTRFHGWMRGSPA